MSFKDLTVGRKINIGFVILVLFCAVLAAAGIWNTARVSRLYESSGVAANATIEILNAQGHELRFVIYNDYSYLDNMNKKMDEALDIVAYGKTLLAGTDGDDLLTEAEHKIASFNAATARFVDVEKRKANLGKIRADAAATCQGDLREAIQHYTALEGADAQIVAMLYGCDQKNSLARENALRFIAKPDDTYADSLFAAIADTHDQIEKTAKLIDDPKCRQMLDQATEAIDTYKQCFVDFRGAISDRTAAMVDMKDGMTGAIALAQEVSADSRNHAEAASTQATFTNYVVAASAISIAILLAIVIVRSINSGLGMVIGGLSTASEQTASAAGQVSSASQALAEGAAEGAASVEETTANVEQMSEMTRQNAANAAEANALASQAKQAAETGNEAMGRMSKAIDDIKHSSDETAKIIKTIDEIAFQTNLLALNAAVEAARAGEAGKGFAVVAEEVRNLAQRSAEAARSTSELIENAVTNSENGVSISTEVASALVEIVSHVDSAAGLIGEIAAASSEQSEGVHQISSSISEIDKVTQGNAATAEQSASASEELSAQAEELRGMVDQLKRMTGSNAGASAPGRKVVNRSNSVAKSQHKAVSSKPAKPVSADNQFAAADAENEEFLIKF